MTEYYHTLRGRFSKLDRSTNKRAPIPNDAKSSESSRRRASNAELFWHRHDYFNDVEMVEHGKSAQQRGVIYTVVCGIYLYIIYIIICTSLHITASHVLARVSYYMYTYTCYIIGCSYPWPLAADRGLRAVDGVGGAELLVRERCAEPNKAGSTGLMVDTSLRSLKRFHREGPLL